MTRTHVNEILVSTPPRKCSPLPTALTLSSRPQTTPFSSSRGQGKEVRRVGLGAEQPAWAPGSILCLLCDSHSTDLSASALPSVR